MAAGGDPGPQGEHGDLVGRTVGWVRDRPANGVHVALNDPQDTIARCEAELAILNEHGPDDTFGPDDVCCSACGDVPQVSFPCRTVRLLAGGYKHRPGYREEDWKP